MIESNTIEIIGGIGLAAWNAYLHYKIENICNTCKYDYTPKDSTKV